MKNIVMAFVLILLVGSGCKYIKKTFTKHIDTLSVDTSSSQRNTIDSSQYISGAEKETTVPVTTAVKKQNAGGNFYMIVGCFTVPANADKYVAKIRGMGYDAQIIQGNDNFQMVAARSYSNLHESIGELDKFRNEVTPRAWVYIRK